MIHQFVTITEAARILGVPGSTAEAAAQKLRRLERRGLIPRARRSLVRGNRYWSREELLRIADGR